MGIADLGPVVTGRAAWGVLGGTEREKLVWFPRKLEEGRVRVPLKGTVSVSCKEN